NGGTAAFQNELYRFVVQRVGFRIITVATTAAAFKATAGLLDTVEDVVVVFRRATQLPGLDHAVNLIVGNEGTVDADRQAGAWRHVQHVTMAQQLLGTALVDDGPGVDLARYLERHTGRNVGLDQTGDH